MTCNNKRKRRIYFIFRNYVVEYEANRTCMWLGKANNDNHNRLKLQIIQICLSLINFSLSSSGTNWAPPFNGRNQCSFSDHQSNHLDLSISLLLFFYTRNDEHGVACRPWICRILFSLILLIFFFFSPLGVFYFEPELKQRNSTCCCSHIWVNVCRGRWHCSCNIPGEYDTLSIVR